MTQEEYENYMATQLNTTVQALKDKGAVTYPCNCGSEDCKGWLMAPKGFPGIPDPE